MKNIKFISTVGMSVMLAFLLMFTGCKKNVPVSGITISSTADTIEVGSTVKLTYTYEPSDATIEGAVWSSSAQTVATVDQSGLVTGVAAGTADIKITVNGQKSATCAVTVLPQMTGIKLSSNSVTIKVDSIRLLTYAVEPAGAKVYKEEWSSSNDDVVFVDQKGYIDAFAEGTALITLKINDQFTDTCRVTVEKNIPPMTGITISSEAETINVGSTVQLSYTVEPAEAKVESAVWSSSDPSVAAVDQGGLVTANGVGNATIIITVNGAFAKECAVRVQESLPEGALPGKFSVSADKKVYFSKGNLWCNTSTSPVTYSFESKQYDYRHYIGITKDAAVIEGSSTTTPANTVGSFYWSKDASVAYASSYNDASSEGDQIFFTNDQTTDTNPNSSLTVNGSTGLWRVPSKEEWTYLLSTRTVDGGTGEGKSYQRTTLTLSDNTTTVYGLIIAPDNYTGSLSATTSWSDWQTMESAGCVFLPAAGYRGSSKVYYPGSLGQYWSSFSGVGSNNAYNFTFKSGKFDTANYGVREFGGTVRMVCAAE